MADEEKYLLLPGQITSASPRPTGCFQQRYLFAFMAFVGFFNVYALRVNLSVAMVAMVNSNNVKMTNSSETQECPADISVNSTSQNTLVGEFDWNPDTQGLILSSFFYGYLLTQLPGGDLSEKFGGKWPFGIGVLMTGVLTLLTPIAARTNVYLLLALRVLEGFGEGVTLPVFQSMMGRWAPPHERSIFSTSMIGCQVGTVVSQPLTAWICVSLGWPYAFYICGAIACVWFVFWVLLVYDSPEVHPRITEEEKQYIITSIGDTRKTSGAVPWKDILTSVPVWSLTLVHTGFAYLFYTLLIDLPTYMKTVLHFNMNENGLLSSLPYLVYTILGLGYSPLADWIIARGSLRTLTVRKLSTAIGMLTPAAFMIGTAWIGCNYYLGVALLTVSCGSLAFCLAGYLPNCVDLAPRYSGTIYGIANTFGTIAGIVSPQVVGALTTNNQTQQQWQIIFFIAGGFCAVSCIPYLLFTQTDRAKWSYEKEEKPLITETLYADRNRLRTIQGENVDPPLAQLNA